MKTALALSVLIVANLLSSAYAQITLPNGVTVPKERMIVFLFAGHSNMAGRCTPDDQTVHERCWAFGASGHNYWEPCKDRIFTNSSGAGPATAFLKNLANRYPTYYFGVIQNANTQVGVRWHNGDSNNRYWKGAGRYEELLGYAKGMKDKVTFGGVITMLGIMEATSGSSTYWNTFADDFTTMASAMRTDLGLAANRLPFLVQDYEREACSGFAANLTGPQAIISQLTQLSSKLTYSAIIPTNSIPCPDQCHHFDLAGMRTWSGRAADSYVSRNWNFWATVETTPPTAPGSLRAGTITENSIALVWNASTDASGIKEYVVYWGTTSKTVTGTATTTTITGLSPSTSYTFTVKATDNAGNVSSASNALTVSTISSSDNVAPSAPANLRAATVFSTSIALAWNASTDNVGVTGYEIFQGSTQIGTTTGASATTYTATGLTASTAYSFTVKARDAAGNRSAASTALNVTTIARAVAALPLRVNVGGGASGQFAADKEWVDGADYGYSGAGTVTATGTTTVSGAGTDNTVYQNVRYKPFTYRVAVTNGDYVVTLLCAEFWRTSAGGRVFNVTFEGTTIPENPIDIFARAGSSTALSIVTAVKVSDGYLDIALAASVSDPMLSGIIVESAAAVKPYVITSPINGATYKVGDTLRVTFTGNTAVVRDANFELSPDGGETWYDIMVDGSISSSDPSWGTYTYVIPARIDTVTVGGKNWMLLVRDYDRVYVVEMLGTIRINSTAVASGTAAATRSGTVRWSVNNGRVSIITDNQHVSGRLQITGLDGTVVFSQSMNAAGVPLNVSSLGRGTYVLTISSDGATMRAPLLIR